MIKPEDYNQNCDGLQSYIQQVFQMIVLEVPMYVVAHDPKLELLNVYTYCKDVDGLTDIRTFSPDIVFNTVFRSFTIKHNHLGNECNMLLDFVRTEDEVKKSIERILEDEADLDYDMDMFEIFERFHVKPRYDKLYDLYQRLYECREDDKRTAKEIRDKLDRMDMVYVNNMNRVDEMLMSLGKSDDEAEHRDSCHNNGGID